MNGLMCVVYAKVKRQSKLSQLFGSILKPALACALVAGLPTNVKQLLCAISYMETKMDNNAVQSIAQENLRFRYDSGRLSESAKRGEKISNN